MTWQLLKPSLPVCRVLFNFTCDIANEWMKVFQTEKQSSRWTVWILLYFLICWCVWDSALRDITHFPSFCHPAQPHWRTVALADSLHCAHVIRKALSSRPKSRWWMTLAFSELIIETSPDLQARIDHVFDKGSALTQWYHHVKMAVTIQHWSTYPLLSTWIQPVPSSNKETVTGWDQSWVSPLTASVRR